MHVHTLLFWDCFILFSPLVPIEENLKAHSNFPLYEAMSTKKTFLELGEGGAQKMTNLHRAWPQTPLGRTVSQALSSNISSNLINALEAD